MTFLRQSEPAAFAPPESTLQEGNELFPMTTRNCCHDRVRPIEFSAIVVLAVLLLLVTAAVAQKPVAELPRVHIDTTWNEPTGGKTWRAHTAAELSTALAKSAPGDVIVLDAGATYVGAFVLPPKDNPQKKWIYIESSALAKLPPGKRVGPEDAANMPKLVTPSVAAAFQVNGGANHWRLAGLELTAASNFPSGCPETANCMTYFLVGSQSRPTPLPDSFVIDRCYIHGSATQDLQSAVTMNASNYAVIDSRISDVHIKGFDSVALGAYWSPGPFKIVNNFLSSSTENVMFGGSGGPDTPYVPSDIEIRNNYLFKPLEWLPLNLNAHSMVVKNAFELKSAQRVLFDGNTIENVWAGGQVGYAIVLTVRSSQSGDIAVVNDVTITNNVLKNVVSGVNTLTKDDQCGKPSYPKCTNPGEQNRWYIANNLILFYDPSLPGGNRNAGIAISPGLQNVVFQHNTMVSADSKPCWNAIFFGISGGKPPLSNITSNIWFLDNVFCRQPTGDWGQQGTSGLTQYMGSPNGSAQDLNKRFLGNVIYVPGEDKPQSFPSHNLATTKSLRFVDPSQGNYDLLQPKWTETTDGKIAGVDSATLPH